MPGHWGGSTPFATPMHFASPMPTFSSPLPPLQMGHFAPPAGASGAGAAGPAAWSGLWDSMQQFTHNAPWLFPAPPPVTNGLTCAARLFGVEGRVAEDPDDGRFHRDFADLTVMGRGQFSTVYKGTSKIDQHTYAIKVQVRPPPGGDSKVTQREAFVLAEISSKASCEHLVRYFSSWSEEGALHIQTELCGGSLRTLMDARISEVRPDPRFSESQLIRLLRHVSSGLSELHRLGFAHVDLKPDNILTRASDTDAHQAHYVIADFGLAITVNCKSKDDMTEGDSRYMPRELLQGDNFDLRSADVFSMGLVAYEVATLPRPMPRNGDEWQQLRNGQLEASVMSPLSEALMSLLLRTVHPDHTQRPSPYAIGQHPSIKEESEEARALRAALRRAEQAEAELQMHRLLAQKLAAVDGTTPLRMLFPPSFGA